MEITVTYDTALNNLIIDTSSTETQFTVFGWFIGWHEPASVL